MKIDKIYGESGRLLQEAQAEMSALENDFATGCDEFEKAKSAVVLESEKVLEFVMTKRKEKIMFLENKRSEFNVKM